MLVLWVLNKANNSYLIPRSTYVPMVLSYLTFILGNIYICSIRVRNWYKEKKTKERFQDPNPEHINQSNELSEHNPVISTLGFTIFVLLLLVLITPLILLQALDVKMSDSMKNILVISGYYALQGIPSVIFPMIYFIKKPHIVKDTYNFIFRCWNKTWFLSKTNASFGKTHSMHSLRCLLLTDTSSKNYQCGYLGVLNKVFFWSE